MINSDKNISNFDYGCKFMEQKFTQDELWDFLANGNDVEKQLACIRITSLENDEQAGILISNLTGVDGKIREVVSEKLKFFTQTQALHKFFLKKEFYPVLLNAIIDINGNICRNIITGLKELTYDDNFCEFMINEIMNKALETCEKYKSFDYKIRKYKTNIEIFKLYWYLAALEIFSILPQEKFYKLANEVCNIKEYTVREKLAVLVAKLPVKEQEKFKKLNFDNNIYVSKVLNVKAV